MQLKGATLARSGRELVSGVDWVLAPGEHWALLGANGAGKSTLIGLARGDMPPTSGARTYCFDGERQSTPIGIRRRMALVSADLQDRYAESGWRITGREAVLAGFFDSWLLYEEPTPEMEAACARTFTELGLIGLAERRVGTMSTGELRKVLLARALVSEPALLFLDEYMDGLDAPSRASLLEVLERAAQTTQLVVAAHRADDIPPCVERALLLAEGRVAVCGSLTEVAAEYVGRSVELPTTTRYDCPVPRAEYDFLFRLRDGAHRMEGTPILTGIDWTMRPGECWAVLGANGSGKSTLLKLLLGLVDPVLGTTIEWFGQPGLPDMTEVRRRVGLVSAGLQAGYSYDLTAEEVVWSGFFGSIGLYAEVGERMKERAAEAMAFFGVDRLAARPISQLSSGQLRRVLLARAVAPGPELLFLDEPTAGLDQAARHLTLDLLQRLAESGMPLVLVTHHEEEIIPAVNRFFRLENGQAVRD